LHDDVEQGWFPCLDALNTALDRGAKFRGIFDWPLSVQTVSACDRSVVDVGPGIAVPMSEQSTPRSNFAPNNSMYMRSS